MAGKSEYMFCSLTRGLWPYLSFDSSTPTSWPQSTERISLLCLMTPDFLPQFLPVSLGHCILLIQEFKCGRDLTKCVWDAVTLHHCHSQVPPQWIILPKSFTALNNFTEWSHLPITSFTSPAFVPHHFFMWNDPLLGRGVIVFSAEHWSMKGFCPALLIRN